MSRPLNPEPFRIEPTFSPRIWGARSLAPLFPEKTNLAEPIGEAWLTDVKCCVATGPFAGKTVGDAWREMPAEWRGSKFAKASDFPLLVKFIFPRDKLSIQVHPDDAYAAKHEKAAGGRGKTEMWHAVSAEPGAQVLVGLKSGVTKQEFLEALTNHTLEDCFLRHDVNAGDTFFIPAGTPHTIGPGMVLCEVQEYSDLTYRVYDYGRVDAHGKRRELHVEKALDVLNFDGSRGAKIAGPGAGEPSAKRLLAACPYFATERWDLLATIQSNTSRERFEILAILDGTGYVHWSGSPILYRRGECWMIPASLGNYSLQPEQRSVIVRTFVPDLTQLTADLRKSNISEAEISRCVFG